MRTKCYLCEKKIETTDLIATLNIHIESNAGTKNQDIIKTIIEENICGWCADRFDYWQKKIIEIVRTEKRGKTK